MRPASNPFSKYPLRVVVIDDSAFMRNSIREMLESDPRIEVVGTANNGAVGLEEIASLMPDVVTVDLIMPDLNGVDLIRRQMARRPLPIIVCSSDMQDGALMVAAMEAGAVDFVQKPTSRALDTVYDIRRELVQAVIAAGEVPFDRLAAAPVESARPAAEPALYPTVRSHDAVLIGLSTGGPRALRYILPQFPGDFPAAIAIVLHMPPGYTQALAQRLNAISRLEVVESANGMQMKPGRAILAQGGANTRLTRSLSGQVITEVSAHNPEDGFYVPSVDVLFRSGADLYAERTLGVVLTGMGNDGTQGAAWIKAQNGTIFAEDESTSVVYGMPRAVIEAGLADRVVPLNRLVQTIIESVK